MSPVSWVNRIATSKMAPRPVRAWTVLVSADETAHFERVIGLVQVLRQSLVSPLQRPNGVYEVLRCPIQFC
jgi:hypothetical protein